MKNEFADEKLARILDKLTGVLPAHIEERALREMAAAGGRSPSTAVGINKLLPNRRRVIALAVGAAVVLFALGFVPFPCGSAKGALTKAMAAFDQLITKHTIHHSWDEQGNEYLTETWFAENGFLRQDEVKGNKLSHVWIKDGTKMLYFYVAEDGQLQAIEQFSPNGAYIQQYDVKLPMREHSAEMVGDTFNSLKSGDVYKDVTINEYQERSLWGGAVNISEVETSHGAPGHGQKWRFEIDPTTDRVMKTVFYVYSGTPEVWKEKSETLYEWDAPIPESAHYFALPKGTKLTRNLWWQDKIDKVIAQGSSPNWEVTLHDVQVDNQGNLLTSISMHHIVTDEASGHGFRGFPEITVQDNVGNEYHNGNSGSVDAGSGQSYEILPITKGAGDSAEIPTSATFTFHLYQDGAFNDQAVVLNDIPLPSRQPLSTEDLMRKDSEVVQY